MPYAATAVIFSTTELYVSKT